MLRLLRTRRWVLLLLGIAVISVLCVFLGRWQWHRHVDRRALALEADAAIARPTAPVGDVLSLDVPVDGTTQFRDVTLTGTYDAAHQVLWRNPNGRGGYDVITPLEPDNGPALLINRGWVGFSTTDPLATASDVTPPAGPVEVTARLRVDAPLDGRTAPQGQIYSVTSDQLADTLPYPIYRGYGELVAQNPAADPAIELPEVSAPGLGPHQLYAYQWWIFSVMVWIGFVLLLRRDAADERAGDSVELDVQT